LNFVLFCGCSQFRILATKEHKELKDGKGISLLNSGLFLTPGRKDAKKSGGMNRIGSIIEGSGLSVENFR